MKTKQQIICGAEIKVFDPKGNLVQHHIEKPKKLIGEQLATLEIANVLDNGQSVIGLVKPMDSYVANMTRFISLTSGGGTTTITDTGGTPRALAGPVGVSWLPSMAASGVETYGIVIGTSNTAVALDDTKINTQLTSAGDGVTYGAMQHDEWTTVGNTTSFKLKRRFTNTTGSPISVYEVAVYTKQGSFFFCVIREVIGGGGWPIPAGGTTEFRFKIPVTLGTNCATNYGKILNNAFVESTFHTARNTVNGNVTIPSGNPVCTLSAPAGNTGYGIIAGTGTTPVAETDYYIGTLIAHGSGSGQLSYQAVLFDPLVLGSTTALFGVKRTMDNLHASTVVGITEMAAVVNHSNNLFMSLRVVLSSTVNVPAAGGNAQCKFLLGIAQ